MEVNHFLLLSSSTHILKYSYIIHSFPQFTGSTLWEEFAWVGQFFSREILWWGAIVTGGAGAVFLGGKGAIVRGKFSSGAVVRTPFDLKIEVFAAISFCKVSGFCNKQKITIEELRHILPWKLEYLNKVIFEWMKTPQQTKTCSYSTIKRH